MRSHSEEFFNCKYCFKPFQITRSYHRHLKRKHGKTFDLFCIKFNVINHYVGNCSGCGDCKANNQGAGSQ